MLEAYARIPENSLLMVISGEWKSVASIILSHIVTAGHVAAGINTYRDPISQETVDTELMPVGKRDIAFSINKTLINGFDKVIPPIVGQSLSIIGFHGLKSAPFEIQVKVTEILTDGRIIVQRLGGAEAQEGMSGSPAVTEKNEVVGILVSGVDGAKRQQLYLETVHQLELT